MRRPRSGEDIRRIVTETSIFRRYEEQTLLVIPVRNLALKRQSVAEELQAEVAKGWDRAIRYYRARGGVVFVSDCQFWGRHGFVQQSLARALAAERVNVLWLDGMGWRPRRPVAPNVPSNLQVRQLFSLPGRRFPSGGSAGRVLASGRDPAAHLVRRT